VGEAPDYHTEWWTDKFSLGMDFPNLPYYKEGNAILSQTYAILKYLGRKHGLAAKNDKEQLRIDLIEAEAQDIRSSWADVMYYSGDNFENSRAELVTNFKAKCKDLSTFLGAHKYFAGETLTYIDFLMYELLDVHSILTPGVIDDFENLKSYHDSIRSLDKVATYLKSKKFRVLTLNAFSASFGGDIGGIIE